MERVSQRGGEIGIGDYAGRGTVQRSAYVVSIAWRKMPAMSSI